MRRTSSESKKAVQQKWKQEHKKEINEHRRKYDKEHPEIKKGQAMKFNYGITLDEYNQVFAAQKGRCMICGIHQSELLRSLAIDHNHETGEFRSLLCANCNTGIGLFHENTGIMRTAISYLEKYYK